MNQILRREVGITGAVFLGLGSILGTGVFVSIGVAAGVAGPAVVLAIVLAAGVATCNGLSTAQLASRNPVSGGAYEYGYIYLNSRMGFTAGWMFLCAKSASAATAALGFSGYVLNAVGEDSPTWQVPLGVAAVALLTLLVLGGIRRSTWTNAAIVCVTLAALVCFVLAGLPAAWRAGGTHLTPFFGHPEAEAAHPLPGFFEACALMFVAYTGYGRIATLGEEVREPETSIPRAVVVTLIVTMLLYSAVGLVGMAAAGVEGFAHAGEAAAAPLQMAARVFGVPGVELFVSMGAVTAMLAVLLNLILGLSRVVLAMGRRGDLPALLARLNPSGTTPVAAVVLVGGAIAGLVLIGNVKTTWSFSAFTVLIYYAITNLAALRMPKDERLYPVVVPVLGLLACVFLAFWVEREIWLAGLALIAGGLLWHEIARRLGHRA